MTKFEHYLDKAFFALISMVSIYIASEMRSMSSSIQELNLKIAAYMQKTDSQNALLIDHESRIRDLEKRR